MSVPAHIDLTGRGISRSHRLDTPLVLLAALHGLLLLAWPSALLIAIGLWWNSNTIAHNAIHRAVFRSRAGKRLFSLYLTLLLGIPQTLWRDRHLAHHAARDPHLRFSRNLLEEVLLISLLWGTLVALAPVFFFSAYLPGYLAGLGLCYLQGHFEHAKGTTSHYGFLYNFLFLNDGYHVEHHRRPSLHWSELPGLSTDETNDSPWPAVLRWLESFSLDGLERAAFRSRWVRAYLCATHERAFRRLLPRLPAGARVGIIGGGLFPRTAIVLRRLLPDAELVVIDMSAESIARAKPWVPEGVAFVNTRFERGHNDFDVLVFPLAFKGSRKSLYESPPASHTFVHDWAWNQRGKSCLISLLLLKRLNRVSRCGP